MNAVMETAAKFNSPVIIQFSYTGAQFVGGKGLAVNGSRRPGVVVGAIAGAAHVNALAAAYGARVVLHTDHCAKDKLGWVDGLLDAGEEYFAATGARCSRRTCSTCPRSRSRRTWRSPSGTSSAWRRSA